MLLIQYEYTQLELQFVLLALKDIQASHYVLHPLDSYDRYILQSASAYYTTYYTESMNAVVQAELINDINKQPITLFKMTELQQLQNLTNTHTHIVDLI